MRSDLGTPSTRPLLVFDLDGQAYAVPLESVREIAFMAELSRPAGLPSLLRGFLTVGGQAVPVLDLRRILGLAEREPQLYTPLVLLRSEDSPLALLVDRVAGDAAVAEASLMPVDEAHSANGCVASQAIVRERAVLLLSLERLLLEQERRCVAELQAAEQRRLAALDAE